MAKKLLNNEKKNELKNGIKILEKIKNGIIAGMMFTVVLSIAWSSYTIWNGIEGNMPKIMIIPQALFASFLTIKAFSAKENK
nr:MAG TPA: hypothetical protein [Bacteriophage sp.]